MSTSVREIHPDLQAKSIKEGNENPNTLDSDIALLRDWISQQSHLKARTDKQWLLNFLRLSRFSMQKAKEKLDIYYSYRNIIPELYINRDPFDPAIQSMLQEGIILPLRQLESPDAPRIFILKADGVDFDKYTVMDGLKMGVMFMDILFNEDDNLIIGGQQVVADLNALTMGHVIKVLPWVNKYKNLAPTIQRVYIPKPNGYHLLNSNAVFETLFAMFKHLVKDKHLNMMKLYNTNEAEKLREDIPKHILPKDLGGEGETLQELKEYWKAKVESYKDWFLEDEKYGADESLRIGKYPYDSGFGVDGSFKTLEVD